jgi:hypothetical protein
MLAVYGIDDAKTQRSIVLGSVRCVIERRPPVPEELKAIPGGPKVILLGSGFGRFDSLGRAENMSQAEGLTDAGLRTPRAAAVAGVFFSLLTLTSFGLLWSAIPADPQASGGWLAANNAEVALALNLIPFAGIAFLWFIGVIRDQLGRREDRFFATVFLGSGLLFLGMLFVAAAVVGAMLVGLKDDSAEFASPAFRFARTLLYSLVNVYMVRMAGVFMISTSTVAMSTHFAPRWLAALGYLLAVLLLLGSPFLRWSFALFPLWVLLLSIQILASSFSRRREG